MKAKHEASEQPSFILWADVHLMETNPVARKDDYVGYTQWEKLKFIDGLQRKYRCPVLCAGDLFDKWKVSPELLTKAMKYLPRGLFTVYGQHELPEHDLKQAERSAVHTLETSGHLTVLHTSYISSLDGEMKFTLTGASWGEDLPKIDIDTDRAIGVMHRFVWDEKEVFSNNESKAINILKKNPMYDLILTGDNHKPFVVQYKGRLLVNPGSFFRITGAQIEHTPRVYLYYAKTNAVQPVYIPIHTHAVSREHLEIQKSAEDRIDAFIASINDDFRVNKDVLNFEMRLKLFFENNKTDKAVQKIIFKSLEDEKV